MFLSPKENVLEFGFLPGQKIADLGAGTGHYALALSRILGPSARIYAVDIQEGALSRLKKQALDEGLRNVDVMLGDLEKPYGTRLRTDLVDGVVVSNTLSQIEDKQAFISEIDRILARKGRVALVDWKEKLEKDAVRKLFEGRGFSFERGFLAGGHHYVLIFKK
ncbi:MAG: methyltransferase domain-containing protein [Parcubacteria group bacterium]